MRLSGFFALPLAASAALAQDSWVESPATLALTLSRSGPATLTPGKNDTVIQENSILRFRLGNRDVLEALRTEGLIDEVQGWRVVGIWAEWPEPADPYVGNAYRFYARRGKGVNLETIAVPSEILSIEPLQAAAGYRHVLAADDSIRSGTQIFSVYQQVTFELAGHVGLVTGVETGSGRYIPVASGAGAGRYLPKASKAILQGEYIDGEDGPSGVVSGTLFFGASKLVTTNYEAPSGTGTGSTGELNVVEGTLTLSGIDSSSGSTYANGGTLQISGGLIKTGSGTLTLTEANTYTGSTTVSNGTLTLGSSGTFAGITSVTGDTLAGSSSLDLSPGNFLTIAGGDYQLFDFGSPNGDFTSVGLSGSFSTSLGEGSIWSGTSGSFVFTFNETDGALTITPAPTPAP